PFSTPPSPTEPLTLSLHDALPISYPVGRKRGRRAPHAAQPAAQPVATDCPALRQQRVTEVCQHPLEREPAGGGRRRRPALRTSRDRKSTRLNSSHQIISYAVFCLK